jgi:quinol monooxygenase YgiN
MPSVDKLALITTIDFKAGEKDRVLQALLAHRDRCLLDEPGTLHFDVLMPRETSTSFFSYEVYENDAAFDAHLHSPSRAQFRNDTDGAIGKISVTQCTPAQ